MLSDTMTYEEAWQIIKECRNWNTEQKSLSFAFGGPRTISDDIYDEKRKALKKAWKVVNDCTNEVILK